MGFLPLDAMLPASKLAGQEGFWAEEQSPEGSSPLFAGFARVVVEW